MSARILIVDDTPLNVKLLTAKLARDYYTISTAGNGIEALKKAAEETPDLILLDVMMPEMDGFETCQRLKANPATAHIPVIIITALTDIAERVKGLAAGADDFLGKPIDDLALMARIRSLLRLKILMDEWRLREATAQQLSPVTAAATIDLLNIDNSRILIIDDQNDSGYIKEALAPLSGHITQVRSGTDAETVLADGTYDLVFANLDLKEEDGLTICARLHTNPATRHVPILLLANTNEMERVAKGLDLGANDYLIRPIDANELFARARTQLRHKRNYDRLRNGFEQNMMMSLVDPLTGAFNRRYLDAHLPRFLAQASDNKKPLTVQVIDIDHFKKVNDTYGHAAGDAVLKEVSRRVMSGVRPSDFFVRMGGEEFAIVMLATTLPSAYSIAERLRQTIADTPIPVEGLADGIKVTISIGMADTNPATEGTSTKVFERADEALYRAKHQGRNRVVIDTPTLNEDA